MAERAVVERAGTAVASRPVSGVLVESRRVERTSPCASKYQRSPIGVDWTVGHDGQHRRRHTCR